MSSVINPDLATSYRPKAAIKFHPGRLFHSKSAPLGVMQKPPRVEVQYRGIKGRLMLFKIGRPSFGIRNEA